MLSRVKTLQLFLSHVQTRKQTQNQGFCFSLVASHITVSDHLHPFCPPLNLFFPFAPFRPPPLPLFSPFPPSLSLPFSHPFCCWKKKKKKKKKKISFCVLPGPITVCSKTSILIKPNVRLQSIFVGQSLYLFEVRHNPAKDFSKAHVCLASLLHVLGW